MKILRLLLALVAVFGLTALLAVALPLPDLKPPAPDPADEPTETAPTPPRFPALDDAYRSAADALRQRDCDQALSRLAPRADAEHPESSFARVVQGLYAHSCEDVERARELLFLGGGRGTVLEDWRLLVLADVTSALGEHAIAEASLEKLLDGHAESPLVWQALETAAENAWEGGDAEGALAAIERSRRQPVQGAMAENTRIRLESLAWEIGAATGSSSVQREAGRRLLVYSPARAGELEVFDAFPEVAESPGVPWTEILTREQLVERARVLLGEDRPEVAATTLAAIPETRHTFDTRLLTVEALTRSRRGAEARELLTGLDPATEENRAALAWARAQILEDMSTAYRGRRNLPSAERRALRHRYREELAYVTRLGHPPWTRQALRELFRERVDQDRFEDAIEVLATLRRLDPADDTGAEWLWNLGWDAYQSRNPTGAIGYWAELASLYPEDRYDRAGQYWTGRAYEVLGDEKRAREIYARVAAVDTTDFYRRYALVRLGEAPQTAPRVEPEPWPDDPVLQRARLLTDLGLEELAQTELEALWQQAEEPAAQALESLILARQGQSRSSIRWIRRAFPDLGSARQAAVPREAMELYYPLAYLDDVRASAQRAGLPLPLVLGMIRQESGFDRLATSRVGAKGLMQLMPATGREVAQRIGLPYSPHRLADPSFNTRLGTTYFRQVLSMFDGNVELALAGYNGGPYRIKRLWRRAGARDEDSFLEGLPVSESKIYVKRIVLLSDSYDRLYELEG